MSTFVPTDLADPARERARAAIAEKRNGIVSPLFETLLEFPAVAEAASNMGVSVRFAGTLPATLRELAICIVAAHWNAEHEWSVHSQLAAQAGIATVVLNAVRMQQPLPILAPEQQAVYQFITGLLREGRASDDVRRQVLKLFGKRQTVELIAIAGYYGLISFVLNTFE